MAVWGAPDDLLAFLIKSAVRAFRYFKSSTWERKAAVVTGKIVQDPIWWGYPSVKLHYRFDSNGLSTKGWDVIPALSLLEARNNAESFRHNLPVTIRVNPKNPQETHFFERDQKRGVSTK
jgi:hypothetical protein